jgi:hypothetical protein
LSWFKRVSEEERRANSQYYPPDVRHFLSIVKDRYRKPFETLKEFHIPLPTQTEDWRTTYSVTSECKDRNCKIHAKEKLSVDLPKFTLPPSFRMSIFGSYCFLVAHERTIEEVEELFNSNDWYTLFTKYQFRWFNQDPYQPFASHHTVEFSPNFSSGSYDLRPLEYIACYNSNGLQEQAIPVTAEELLATKRGIEFFNPLAYGIHPPAPFEQMFYSPVPKNDLSPPTVEPSALYFKVLPSRQEKIGVTEQFLLSLRQLKHTAFFSITAAGTIQLWLSCSPLDRQLLEHQLSIYFKDAAVLQEQPVLPNKPCSVLWAIPKLPGLPLNTSFKLDPYAQLFASFESLAPDAYASMRVYFAPIENKPFQDAAAVLEWYAEYNSHSQKKLAGDARQRIRDIEKKLPYWRVLLQFASSDQRFIERVPSFLAQYQLGEAVFSSEIGSELMWGYCSTSELASLAHFPGSDIASDLLETASMKARLPPDLYTQAGIRIGASEARGQSKPVCIPDTVRDRHTYVVGKSGTGKSTPLYNCICQDIAEGSGVAVIDPHGDLVLDVLNFIPESRIEDTIYFNTADKEFPIGLNIVNAQTEEEIGLLADDLLVTFKRLSETWGERLDTILRYTFHTLLRLEDATLLDIARLLQDERFRAKALKQITSPLIHEFWENQYDKYPRDAAQPVLNRLAKFALSPILSGILGQADASLSFFDVIQNKKILLVNLSKGLIGEDSAQLLGSLIVSQLQMSIMRRAALPKEARDPYYLYVDEFQNFTTSAFEKILSEARKYKLCLTLAHQYISQLDEKTKNAILANVGTIIMFQSYPQDAAALRPELGQYEPSDVTNLDTSSHEALCKPATQSKDTFKFQTAPPVKSAQSFVREIIEYTRENYATQARSEPQGKTNTKQEAGSTSPPPPDEASRPAPRQPAKALPKEFATTGDKILHYVKLAEYLSTPQIHSLCYSHVAEGSRASNASRDLKNLIEAKRIKFQNFGKGKIYYSGRTINPTTHNLAIRDLFVKIVASDFELAEVNFFPLLPALTPDLSVSFAAEDGSLIKTFWEYDTGTEGVAELAKKVARYEPLSDEHLIAFVFNTRERLERVCKTITAPFITVAVLDQFQTLIDEAFSFANDLSGSYAFFS